MISEEIVEKESYIIVFMKVKVDNNMEHRKIIMRQTY